VAPPAGGTKEGCLVGGSTNDATLAIRTSAVQGPVGGSACGLGSRTGTVVDWAAGGSGCNATTPNGTTADIDAGALLVVVAGFATANVPTLLLALPVVPFPFPSELVTIDGAAAAPAPVVSTLV